VGRVGGRGASSAPIAANMLSLLKPTILVPNSFTRSLSIGSTQPIPDAGFRQNVLRPLRIGLNLLPKLPHIDPHILRVCQIIPQFAEQEFVSEHFTGVLDQNRVFRGSTALSARNLIS
jgi:hypothetical protein